MEEIILPFQYGDKQAANELLENMRDILKDSDATKEKEIINDFLRKASDTLCFTVLGESGVGKTSLLGEFFGSDLFGAPGPTSGICEYRYGEETAEFPINEAVVRKFECKEVLKGISVVDMPGCDKMSSPKQQEIVKQYMEKSDVLLVVFSSDTVSSYSVWDFLENVEARKVIFVLNKADTYQPEDREEKMAKVKQYAKEAGIEAPVFCSIGDNQELKDYINKNVIGPNPGLKRQRENVVELKGMLQEVASSFALRKKQYEADLAVLEKINKAMDGFVINSQEKIDILKDGLKREIETAIDEYESEIIARLDPKKIKERFPKGYSDFMDYLNFVNDSYQKKMTENVNHKTQETIRSYLSELEQIFDEATGYFRKRESLLSLEDKFYGSLAQGKQQIVAKLGNELQETKTYYGRLTSASEELFMKIWAERVKHDRRVSGATALGGAAGLGAGVVAGAGVAGMLTQGGTFVAGVKALLTAGEILGGAVLWPVVGAIVGGLAIAYIARKIASAKSMEEMELKVQEAIAEFRQEVAQTRNQMADQILATIDEIFRRELDTVDKTFVDFRMTVNIDGRNVPLLEERMMRVDTLMRQIEQVEKERMLKC